MKEREYWLSENSNRYNFSDSGLYNLIVDRQVGRAIDEKIIPNILQMYPVFFKNFNYDDGYKFFKCMEPYFYIKNTFIYQSSDESDGVFLINSGVVALCHPEDKNRPLILLEAGSYFGERFILSDGLHEVTSYNFKVVSENAKLMKVSKDVILDALNKDYDKKAKFRNVTANRWVHYFNLEIIMNKHYKEHVEKQINRIQEIQHTIELSTCSCELKSKYGFTKTLDVDTLNLNHRIFSFDIIQKVDHNINSANDLDNLDDAVLITKLENTVVKLKESLVQYLPIKIDPRKFHIACDALELYTNILECEEKCFPQVCSNFHDMFKFYQDIKNYKIFEKPRWVLDIEHRKKTGTTVLDFLEIVEATHKM